MCKFKARCYLLHLPPKDGKAEDDNVLYFFVKESKQNAKYIAIY